MVGPEVWGGAEGVQHVVRVQRLVRPLVRLGAQAVQHVVALVLGAPLVGVGGQGVQHVILALVLAPGMRLRRKPLQHVSVAKVLLVPLVGGIVERGQHVGSRGLRAPLDRLHLEEVEVVTAIRLVLVPHYGRRLQSLEDRREVLYNFVPVDFVGGEHGGEHVSRRVLDLPHVTGLPLLEVLHPALRALELRAHGIQLLILGLEHLLLLRVSSRLCDLLHRSPHQLAVLRLLRSLLPRSSLLLQAGQRRVSGGLVGGRRSTLALNLLGVCKDVLLRLARTLPRVRGRVQVVEGVLLRLSRALPLVLGSFRVVRLVLAALVHHVLFRFPRALPLVRSRIQVIKRVLFRHEFSPLVLSRGRIIWVQILIRKLLQPAFGRRQGRLPLLRGVLQLGHRS
mmetsp:Transcript_40160/g.94419  ORF Transcript_40160/g.94419 Transcript_40160/m.94419 type:complete len:394 (-) Transcript_40160:228-1409(-)